MARSAGRRPMDRRDPLRVPARTLNRPVSEHPPPGRRVHSVVAGRAAGPGSEVGWAGWVNERGGAWPHPPLRFHARAVQLAKRPLHRPAPAVPGHAARPERRRWVWLVLVHGGGQVKRRYAPRAPPPPPPPPGQSSGCIACTLPCPPSQQRFTATRSPPRVGGRGGGESRVRPQPPHAPPPPPPTPPPVPEIVLVMVYDFFSVFWWG